MPMPATLEGQIARYADRIAYINHDIDDAIRAGILTEEDLPEETRRVLGGGHRERIGIMVNDLVAASVDRHEIGMSPAVSEAMGVTRTFLFERVYLGRVSDATKEAVRHILGTLLEHHAQDGGEAKRVAAVDYVAGMTDRFALRAFEALVGSPAPFTVLG
jgi:dGTPase